MKVSVTLNERNMVALPPMSHMPTKREKELPEFVRVGMTEEGIADVLGIPGRTDAFVKAHAE